MDRLVQVLKLIAKPPGVKIVTVMKKTPSLLLMASLQLVGCFLHTLTSQAEVKTFTVDPTASSLSITGDLLGISAEEQAPGSLTTTYSGVIVADVTETSVAFPGGSSIIADNSGSWKPATGGVDGNEPANYGAEAGNFLGSGVAALRNVVFEVKSGVIDMLGGTFVADGLEFSLPDTATSTIDYSYSSIIASGTGGDPLKGNATNNVVAAANISVVGGELVLTIPIDYTLVLDGDFSAEFRVRGQLVGRVANVERLMIPLPVLTPGHIGFSIPTQPGKTYTILASTDLINFPTVVDQFEGDGTTQTRDIEIQSTGLQFFILKEE